MIVKRFDACLEAQLEFLLTLPVAPFSALLRSNDLNIREEYILVELGKQYMDRHKEC